MRAELREVAAEIASTPGITDHHELLRRDVRVHRSIYRAAGNPHLEDILVRQDNLATRIWGMFLDRLPGLAGHISEHIPLLDAIIAGESERAGQLALEHVIGFEKAIRGVM